MSQVVYLLPERTTFKVDCETCAAEAHRLGTVAIGIAVEGSLRRDVDVGFRTCRRGHRILVRRMRMPSPKTFTAA